MIVGTQEDIVELFVFFRISGIVQRTRVGLLFINGRSTVVGQKGSFAGAQLAEQIKFLRPAIQAQPNAVIVWNSGIQGNRPV